MITFQCERWADCVEEMRPLWEEHFAELALNQDRVSLRCDEDKFAQGDAAGCLHIVTVRSDRLLVGYYYGILMHHLHYRDSGLMCYTDAYFIRPEFRRGITGVRFLAVIKRSLRDRGVVKLYMTTKVHQNHGELFARMGGIHSDDLYTWML